ncbi:sensor histidine kinase KdpD [Massilia sp. 9096]|uniref:sensor histidine kinase n=1 Tax=Massilia sp. 9096 TaxID=1500894 RepID=UPI00068C68AC|nr:HAMP domain-containing sensor histidine kinase [Massilia sp. 9096]
MTTLIPTDRFSFNSHRMLALRDTVLRVWEDHVVARLPRAQGVSRPVLTDTMPVMYERLCAALTPDYFERDGLEVSTLGAEHGVERANLTDYDADTIVAEFQLFRGVLFDVVDAHDIDLTTPERRALHLTIDAAVRESVRAFVVAGNALRERVAAALAHDLRRPVSNVTLGASQILQMGAAPGIAELAERILRNGERMEAMLGELLETLAIRSSDRLQLELEQFDLLALARTVAQRARDYGGADVALSGEPVTGWWNGAALERALEILLTNAQRQGEPGTPIEIKVGTDLGRAILTVRNHGKPIPKEDFEAIFEQFVRTQDAAESATGSWGVGLPYVRTVAQSHGGSAVVFSDAAAGTVFVIDVPVDARPFQGDRA